MIPIDFRTAPPPPDAREEKRAESARIARDIAEFERRGGQIERLHHTALSSRGNAHDTIRAQHIAAARRGRAARGR